MYTHTVIPNQRVSLKEKEKNDYELMKKTMDAIVTNFYAQNTYYDSDERVYKDRDYFKKLSNYMLFNNQIDQSDFFKEMNQYGFSKEVFKEKEIKPYNKAPNKIQVLLGEELARPFNFQTVITNSDGISEKLLQMEMTIRDYIDSFRQRVSQMISEKVNASVQQGQQELTPEQEQELNQQIEQLIESFVSTEKLESLKQRTILTRVERLCSRFMSSMVRQLNIKDKSNDGFKHGLIAGEEIIWVGVTRGKLVLEVVNPLGSIYDKNPDTKWIEEGNYAGRSTLLTKQEVLAKWSDQLTPEQRKKFEDNYFTSNTDMPSKGAGKLPTDTDLYRYNAFVNPRMTDYGQYGPVDYSDEMIEEIHLEWKSLKKVYFIEYQNEYGDNEIKIASEDLVIPEYAVKQTEKVDNISRTVYYYDQYKTYEAWIEEVWQGIRLGEDIYINISPKEYQFRSIDDPYTAKLGYHGATYSNMNAPSTSLMDRMKPFIYLYIMIAHRLKEFIAQDRAPLIHFDVSMVDPKIGLEKTIYYMDQLNIDFFNPLQNAEKPGGHMRGGKNSGATERSTMQHINNYISLLAAIDENISDVAGVTRQREGQSSPYEAVGNNQQAIIQSSHITQTYFHIHNQIWEKALNSLLNTALQFYKNKGIFKQYVLDNLDIEILQLLPEDLTTYDMGIYFSNSNRDQEIFAKLERLTEVMITRDQASVSDLIAMFKAQSITEIEQAMKDAVRSRDRQMQAQQQAQQEAIKAEADAKRELLDHEYDRKERMQRELLENQLRLKEMDVFKYQRDLDTNMNAVPDHLEVEKLRLEEKKVDVDAQIKREDMKSKETIAKEKANKPASTK